MSLCYSAIDNCGGQFNRLDCDGNVLSGPEDVIVSCSPVEFSIEPIPGEERNQNDPNGAGGYCASRDIPAKIEGYEVELTLCSKTDVLLMELMGLGTVVKDAEGNCVGWDLIGCCEDDECLCDPGEEPCSNPGIALHLWHVAWCGDERLPDYKWAVRAFPKIIFDASTMTVTRNSEFNTYTMTGKAYCNDNYVQGPGAIYPNPAGLTSCGSEWVTNEAPDNLCSCEELCGYAAPGAAVGN